MKVAILGYGIEGKAAAAYFFNKGYEVTICDEKKIKLERNVQGSKVVHGADYLKNLDFFDLIIRSPGISPNKTELKAHKNKISSATKYFFENCPCKIVGVTGTKGKGTTATLLFEMLKKSKRGVYLGGNIGTPPLVFLDKLKKEDLVILELSSFQLMDLDRSPDIALVLGITPDHLNYHSDFDEYIEAKKNIIKFQKKSDLAIIDIDNKESVEFAKSTKGKVFGVSIKKPVNKGGYIKVGKLVLVDDKEATIIGETDGVKLIGEHNIKNILMAGVAANKLGVSVEVIQEVAQTFAGLPHRLEFVARKDGVDFYNDSASTNPHTAIAAIHAFKKPMILIVGGASKGVDFETLAHEIVLQKHVKTVVLLGETKKEIEDAIDDAALEQRVKVLAEAAKKGKEPPPPHGLEIIVAQSMAEACMVARLVSTDGDVVVLSPACTSFDMFADYKERGEAFKTLVLE